MSARQVKPVAADDLFDAGPVGCLTPEGWRDSTPAQRAERVLFEAGQRIAQAASAVNAGMVGAAEERAAALFFIADGLRRQAKLVDRARRVLAEALRHTEDSAARIQRAPRPPGPKAARAPTKLAAAP